MVLDRRRFLTGGRPASHAPEVQVAEVMVCTIIVQLKPDRIDAALAAVSALDGIAVTDRNARGRVTLALSGRASDDIARTLAAVSDLPGVVSAMLAPAVRMQAPSVRMQAHEVTA